MSTSGPSGPLVEWPFYTGFTVHWNHMVGPVPGLSNLTNSIYVTAVSYYIVITTRSIF